MLLIDLVDLLLKFDDEFDDSDVCGVCVCEFDVVSLMVGKYVVCVLVMSVCVCW